MTPLAPKVINIPSGNAVLKVCFYPKPQAPTIILLHGGPGVPDDMTEIRDWLCQRMQVINFDQRGTGEDVYTGCTFTMDDFVSDLNTLAAYFNLEQFHLFGHSWGGLYAQIYAMYHPQRILSLFLCSPASGTGNQWKITEKEIFRYNLSRSSVWEILGMAFYTVMGMTGYKTAYRRLFRQIIINYHKGYAVDPPDEEKLKRINSRAGLYTRRQIKKYAELPDFGVTPYPVMITYGQFDAYGASREFVLRRFKYATTTIIPKSGHTPWKHNWPGFLSVLEQFYTGL
jgi:proline iminopeptidase